MGVRIEGVEEAYKFFEDFPINAHKVVKKCVRKAGAAGAKLVKSRISNKKFRSTVKSKTYGQEYPTAYVGFFDDKKQDGNLTNWFKAYFSNYGTLSLRDPDHKFDNPRKRITASWKGGIAPRHFFEKSLDGVNDAMVEAFTQEMDKNEKKLMGDGQ